MVKIPDVPRKEIERNFPGGFTARDEANALMAFAIHDIPKGDGPLDELHASKKIRKAEKDRVVLFGCKKLESLLRMREKEPERYRTVVMWVGSIYCKGWKR